MVWKHCHLKVLYIVVIMTLVCNYRNPYHLYSLF